MGKSSELTLSDALTKIEENSDRFKSYALDKEGGIHLLQAVKTACKIYLSVEPPKLIKGEIDSLERAIRSRPMDVHRLMSEASPDTLRLIYQSENVPSTDELSSLETRNEALKRLREALISSEISPGKIKTIGPKLKRGRQKNTSEVILVSFLAAAFAKATESPASSSWSTDTHSGDGLSSFERLVEDVFVALLIDDQYSVRNLVRLHIEERDRETKN